MIKTIANELRKIALKKEPELLAKAVFRIIEDRVKKITPTKETGPLMKTIIDGLTGQKMVVEPKVKKNIKELKNFIERRTKDVGMDPSQVIQRLIPMKQRIK